MPCPRPSTQRERWDQGSWLLYALLCTAKFGEPKGHPIGDPSQALPVPKEGGFSGEGTQGWGPAHCNKSCHRVWGHLLGTARSGTGWRSEGPKECPGAEGAARPHAPPGAAEHSQPRFPTAPTCCEVCSCWGHRPEDTALGLTAPTGGLARGEADPGLVTGAAPTHVPINIPRSPRSICMILRGDDFSTDHWK